MEAFSMFWACDELCLRVKKDDVRGFVLFIGGNGYHVIVDYTITLDAVLKSANEAAEAMGA